MLPPLPTASATPLRQPDIDATRCPICQQPNHCAMEQARLKGRNTPVSCWCVEASFTPELLALVPAHTRRKTCICHACATAPVFQLPTPTK